jgi:uncharacterized membrane protein YuzA (DUF378 family)
MANTNSFPHIRATLLFLLFPLLGELLFLDMIIQDVYARRRIRIMFSIFCLALIAIWFSALEILFSEVEIRVNISYPLVGLAGLIMFILFSIEGWTGKVSLKEQIVVPEDRVSLSISNPQDVFVTLHRILNAAQLRRYKYNRCDNSRLAKYALAILSEYLRTKVIKTLKIFK